MHDFKVIAFTHKNLELEEVGMFHLTEEAQKDVLLKLKTELEISELMYLSTCNRVEFLVVTEKEIDFSFIKRMSLIINHLIDNTIVLKAQVFSGIEAIKHVFKVASSIDSLVVGEREIITQVRNSFEKSKELEITGDLIRLIMRRTIETAKLIYTQTEIANSQVSITSLAYRKLKELNVSLDSRILIVGSGKTNTSMAKFLKKHGFTDFCLYNRTLENADRLSNELGCTAKPLAELENHTKGFDILLSCTGSSEVIIDNKLYCKLLQGDKTAKIIIDLAIPFDIAREVIEKNNVHTISIDELKKIATLNLKTRERELEKCEVIIEEQIQEFNKSYHSRKVELAMQGIPVEVKKIRQQAMDSVFAKELSSFNNENKIVLDRILNYIEKKYISVPIKIAKDILIDEEYKRK